MAQAYTGGSTRNLNRDHDVPHDMNKRNSIGAVTMPTDGTLHMVFVMAIHKLEFSKDLSKEHVIRWIVPNNTSLHVVE